MGPVEVERIGRHFGGKLDSIGIETRVETAAIQNCAVVRPIYDPIFSALLKPIFRTAIVKRN